MVQVPPEFTSLYRLFLRTVSAAVLHHPQARRNLRRLWRPVFEAGARVTKQYHDTHKAEKRTVQLDWLKQWHQRMDNTLAMLYTSSQSRGLPHNLTRNLGYLVHAEQQRVKAYRLKAWDPQKPNALVDFSERARKKLEKEQRYQELVARAWNPLSQVIKLAEAKDGLTLGRIAVRGWKAQFMRERGL
ncbi:hypothetical protein AX15_000769 [Amanita polypyramis BW_CC]|nr:hypothetical protein AX15_000769 [Amanita polypyramis BW_CC]